MKIIVKYDRKAFPPVLSLVIYGAPHRRMHHAVITQYRGFLRDALTSADVSMPIDEPIDLMVSFINPSSPDLDNLIMALFRALDGKTLRGNGILSDDGLIQKVTMTKFYNQPRKK
jgi:Holliday junction resolvase RusA-like endonuclease